jgi:hypothetical protein
MFSWLNVMNRPEGAIHHSVDANRGQQAPAALLAPLDLYLQPGVERLPHPARYQGQVAQQPDDFPLAGRGQTLPDTGPGPLRDAQFR